jgi:hypothetical protein
MRAAPFRAHYIIITLEKAKNFRVGIDEMRLMFPHVKVRAAGHF